MDERDQGKLSQNIPKKTHWNTNVRETWRQSIKTIRVLSTPNAGTIAQHPEYENWMVNLNWYDKLNGKDIQEKPYKFHLIVHFFLTIS